MYRIFGVLIVLILTLFTFFYPFERAATMSKEISDDYFQLSFLPLTLSDDFESNRIILNQIELIRQDEKYFHSSINENKIRLIEIINLLILSKDVDRLRIVKRILNYSPDLLNQKYMQILHPLFVSINHDDADMLRIILDTYSLSRVELLKKIGIQSDLLMISFVVCGEKSIKYLVDQVDLINKKLWFKNKNVLHKMRSRCNKESLNLLTEKNIL